MNQTSSGDRRVFSRIPFSGEVIVTGKQKQWKGALIDISLKGTLVSCPPEAARKDEAYELEIRLPNSGVHLCMSAIAVHVRKDCVGFRCAHIDLDSITHLRRLVELNLGDEELLHRELSALMKTAG